MKSQKLEISVVYEGLWAFIKKEFKRIDTWAMISFLTYLGVIGLGLLIGALISLNILYFVFNAPAIFDFQQKPLVFIGSIVVTLLVAYLVYKLLKKMMGIANILMFNVLAAVENKTLPKFSIRDERFGIVGLGFVYLLMIIVGGLFLVVPGIIFLIRFSMSYMIMLDEQCSMKEALQKSWELTEGNFWPIFVFIFPIMLISSVIPLLAIVYMFLPLNMWVYGYIYNQLKQQ